MNEFNEKNRRVLRFCCKNLQSIGFLMLICGLIISFAVIILKLVIKFGYWDTPEPYKMVVSLIPFSGFNIIFYGLGILGLVQVIRYLVEENYEQGWILRHGDKLCYLYAIFIFLNVVWIYIIIPGMVSLSSGRSVFTIVMTVISITVRSFILVSLGQILRRILPIIEESKTLV